jgi:hypothetical protein
VATKAKGRVRVRGTCKAGHTTETVSDARPGPLGGHLRHRRLRAEVRASRIPRRDPGGQGHRRRPGAGRQRQQRPAPGPRGDQLWTAAEQSTSTRARPAPEQPAPAAEEHAPGLFFRRRRRSRRRRPAAGDGDSGGRRRRIGFRRPVTSESDDPSDDETRVPRRHRRLVTSRRSCSPRSRCGDRRDRGEDRHRDGAHRRREDRGAEGRRAVPGRRRRRRRNIGHPLADIMPTAAGTSSAGSSPPTPTTSCSR